MLHERSQFVFDENDASPMEEDVSPLRRSTMQHFFNRDQSCPRNKFAYRSLEKPVFKKMDIYIYLREDAQLLSPLIIYRAVSSTKKGRLPLDRLQRLFNNT